MEVNVVNEIVIKEEYKGYEVIVKRLGYLPIITGTADM